MSGVATFSVKCDITIDFTKQKTLRFLFAVCYETARQCQ